MEVSGILNVDKPAGLTSFQVVSLVRRHGGVRRVGHAGTLDPAATGVLLVCVGQAARVTEYLMRLPKTYRATLTLGVATSTYDAEGEAVATADPGGVTEAAFREAMAQFTGQIMQTPPAYSAVKVGGERAYRLARRGEAVELKPRPARIDRIDVLRFELPLAEIEVDCGKGTYIRSLAHDVGQALGCGAHLSALRRTRVGSFGVEEAVTLEEFKVATAEDTWVELLLPLDCGLVDLPAVTLDIEDEKDMRHGQAFRIDPERLSGVRVAPGLEFRAYAEDGSLAGIIVFDAEQDVWRPRKVFGAGEGIRRSG